ncbi:MAG: ABC transporter substrate-binding protein [Propionivibrio sp.]
MSPARLASLMFCLLPAACGYPQNDPYPADERGRNTLYTAFTERPKHLDPARSYSEDESVFTAQIYEAPLQYHYLKRPYTLVPAAAEAVPHARYLDAAGQVLPDDAPAGTIARSVYEIRIRPGIRYQPHPAFAVDAAGQPVYPALDRRALAGIDTLSDFEKTGARELVADDYIYQIKRLAHPRLHSPIYGMMAERIVGLKALGEALQNTAKDTPDDAWLDLERFPLEGVTRVDRYTYRIAINGKYPQFLYWLAMPFFAPVPREVDRFYSQPGMAEKNLTLDWYPVGTGPYRLAENDPNRRMVLERNPNFHGETYPCEGETADKAAGLLEDCGKPLPRIDRVVFTRETESIPYWNKFLQGYYDASGIASDSFDQAVSFGAGGAVQLTEDMRAREIRLLTSVRPSLFYMGFNMLDATIGTASGERARKLRQALSIAVDQEEFISIFMNGRGIAAMNPIPPGIFGHGEGASGINPVVYDWAGDALNGQPRRKPIEAAKKLLADAGWPSGRDAQTNEPLVLYLDTPSGMGDKATMDWLTRQFAKIDIQLVVRQTDGNRFQDKLRKGAVQIFFFGWNADYPDPENFFFLLSGGEGKVANGGENAANYANPEFDRLFAEMKNMESDGPTGARRAEIIARMNRILQHDAPWIFGFHPKSYTLAHAWLQNRKPMGVGNNALKYQRIDVAEREKRRRTWNAPVLWPLALIALLLAVLAIPAVAVYRRHERSMARESRPGT